MTLKCWFIARYGGRLSNDGWDKSTVDYLNDNKAKVIRTIYGIARKISGRHLQTADVEDIYTRY